MVKGQDQLPGLEEGRSRQANGTQLPRLRVRSVKSSFRLVDGAELWAPLQTPAWQIPSPFLLLLSCFILESHPEMLRLYSWLYPQDLLSAGGPLWHCRGMQPGSPACQASA